MDLFGGIETFNLIMQSTFPISNAPMHNANFNKELL